LPFRAKVIPVTRSEGEPARVAKAEICTPCGDGQNGLTSVTLRASSMAHVSHPGNFIIGSRQL